MKAKELIWNPDDDGVTHVNVYSRGFTVLGKALSNWEPLPNDQMIETPHGPFRTIEGYWAWLGFSEQDLTPSFDVHLRSLLGLAAKRLIDDTGPRRFSEEQFRGFITEAMRSKLASFSPSLRMTFYHSRLPFVHYYRTRDGIPIKGSCQWVMQVWERMRKEGPSNENH
jgi:hypothetical protein